jgi:hypothetical protein
MANTATMADRTDYELLDLILNSNAAQEEKARAVLTVREHSALKRQTRYLVFITLVASLATSIQAIPIVSRLLSHTTDVQAPPVCRCPPSTQQTAPSSVKGGPTRVR